MFLQTAYDLGNNSLYKVVANSKMEKKSFVYKFFFYFLISFPIAVGLYYFMLLIGIDVFRGNWGRYARIYPVAYIFIPCFFYSVLVAMFHKYVKKEVRSAVLWTFFLIILSSFFSVLAGGILCYIHDMMAGWFPENYLEVLFTKALRSAMLWGWGVLFIGTYPYNIFGIFVCYFLTSRAEELHQYIEVRIRSIK